MSVKIMDFVNNQVDNLKGLFSSKGKGDDVKSTEEEDIKLMAEYDTKMEDCALARSGYEQLWFTNIAFVLGRHWVSFDGILKTFYEPKVPDWRVRLVCNKILPRYRKALNRLSTYDPVAVVTPNSNETLDIESAQLGTKVLRGLKDKVHMAKKNHQMNQWRLLCGSAFKYFFWNPTLGSNIPEREDQAEPEDEFSILKETNEGPESPEIKSKEKPESENLMTGDVDVEVWNAFEVYPLDNPDSMESCRKLMHARYVSTEWIKQQYPKTGAEVKPEKDDTTAGMYLTKIAGIIGGNDRGNTSANTDEDKVLYKRVFERRSQKYPKGRFVAYANKVMLDKGDLPNIDLGVEFEMPVCKYDDLEVPGRFWGQSTIEQQIPINKEYNKSISQIIESRNLMSKPKWTVVKGTVSKTAITSAPNEVIEWNAAAPGATKPQMVTPPSLPQYVIALPKLLEDNLSDVGAMHEASQSQLPDGKQISGTAIKELKQSDEEEMNPLFVQDTENKKVIYTGFLKMVQKNYTEERLIKVVGKDKITDVISFTGADLQNNTDVWVETTDVVPASRAGRQAMVMSFYNDGLLGDKNKDETRQRTIRLLEYGNIDDIYEDSTLDAKQARHENKELAKGNWIDTESWDVHSAHILEHEKPIKSPLFRTQDKKIQDAHIKHMQDHQDWAMGINPKNPKANINVQPPMGGQPPPPPGAIPGVGASPAGGMPPAQGGM